MTEQPRLSGAVFLSYASEDADAAARICEALQAAGVEVWFDRSELRGGDAWDSQIKKQIHDCALFLPLISAHSNSRTEGYFRREWNLAKRRLLDRADDAAFLVPVVIDETREADARVPEEFLGVQWTWLTDGIASPAFAQRVRQLLSMNHAAVPAANSAATATIAPGDRKSRSVRLRAKRAAFGGGLALIALLLVLGSGAIWYAEKSSDAPAVKSPNDKSIAVLPFVDLSPNKDQEYFSDGISEEVLNLLAKVPGLRVISRSSAFSYKGRTVKLTQIARELDVAHILEGSVRKAGNQLRISVQLIDARSDTQLWSNTWDRKLDDIFAVQDEIAATVVEQLKIKLMGNAPVSKQRDATAYALFLQARKLGHLATAEGYAQAIALLQQVLAIDPSYAEAWDELAFDYERQGAVGTLTTEVARRLALDAVNKALAIDPGLARAHARLAWFAYVDGDTAAAARHVRQAHALDPRNYIMLGVAATVLSSLGRFQQATEIDEYLVVRDPTNPIQHVNLGDDYLTLGRYDDAIASFRTALRLTPGRASALEGLVKVLLMKGDGPTAFAAIQDLKSEESRREWLPLVLHLLGDKAKSNAAFDDLLRAVRNEGSDGAYAIARAAAFRGESDIAFDWLESTTGNSGVNVEPFFRGLRSDHRWLPYLRKHGWAPEQLAKITLDVQLPQ